MKKEDMMKAATLYADDVCKGPRYRWGHEQFAMVDFIEGAKWRIDSVWHDRAEKADTSKELILMYSNCSVRVTLLNPNLTFDGFLSVDMFIKWAYVSDLLPEREEDEQ